jgi:hypothetical protein
MEYMNADYYQAQNKILGVDTSAYKVKGIDYKTLLSNNHTECLIFDSCPPLENIEQDIKNYLMENAQQ